MRSSLLILAGRAVLEPGSVNNYGLHLMTMDEGGCGLPAAFAVLELKDTDAAATFPREMLRANPHFPGQAVGHVHEGA